MKWLMVGLGTITDQIYLSRCNLRCDYRNKMHAKRLFDCFGNELGIGVAACDVSVKDYESFGPSKQEPFISIRVLVCATIILYLL